MYEIEGPSCACWAAHPSHNTIPLFTDTFVGFSFSQSAHLLFSSSIDKIISLYWPVLA